MPLSDVNKKPHTTSKRPEIITATPRLSAGWVTLFFDRPNRHLVASRKGSLQPVCAEAYGIKAKKVSERADLAEAVEDMFIHDGPFFLEVVVEKEDNVFPMIATGCSVEEVRLN